MSALLEGVYGLKDSSPITQHQYQPDLPRVVGREEPKALSKTS